MTTRRLVTNLAMLAILAMATRVALDSDTWWHLRAGQWIVENGRLLREDLFSHTRFGEAWHYPGWLAQVILYGAYRVAGMGGLNLLTASSVTLAFVFVYRSTRGDAFLRSFTLLLAATASAVYWSARPQIFSLLLAAIFGGILESYRHGRNRLWLLPVLMAVWVNLHGGFAIGFILIALTMLGLAAEGLFTRGEGRRVVWRQVLVLAGIGLVCAAAVGLNPFGYEMLAYPFKTVGIGALQAYIQEWQSPDFHTREAQPFLWLLLATLAAIGFSRKPLTATDFVLVAGTAYLGFLAGRNIPLLSIAAPPVLVRHGQAILDRVAPAWGRKAAPGSPPGRLKWLNVLVLALALLAIGLKARPVLDPDFNLIEVGKTQPLKSIEYLRTHHGLGRMLNSYNWGGYLIWALRDYPVFVDGRTDLYDDEMLTLYLAAVRGEPNWQQIFQKWDIGVVRIEPRSPLVTHLRAEGWKTAAADDLSVILIPPGATPLEGPAPAP